MLSCGAELAAACCTGLILFLRSMDTFLHPISGWEDGTEGLHAYTSSTHGIFHFYAGYVSVLPNLIDWLAVTRLPLQAVPFVQAGAALAAGACVAPAMAGFFRTMLGWRPWHAATIATLVTCLPWGDVAAISNTEFAIWSLLAVLLLTACNAVPVSLSRIFLFVAWRSAIITSVPVSAICLPLWCGGAWRRRQPASLAAYSALALVTLLYLKFGVGHARAPPLTWHGVRDGLQAASRLATEKSLLAIVVRDLARINYGAINGALAAVTAGGATLLLLLALPPRAAPARRAVLLLAATVGAVCLACGMGRGMQGGAAFVLASPRYHYVPQLLWLMMFAIVIHARATRVVLAVALLAYGLVWEKGWKSYRSDNAAESDRLIAFLKAAEIRRDDGRPGEMRLARTGAGSDWTIVLFAGRDAPPGR